MKRKKFIPFTNSDEVTHSVLILYEKHESNNNNNNVNVYLLVHQVSKVTKNNTGIQNTKNYIEIQRNKYNNTSISEITKMAILREEYLMLDMCN